MTHPRARDILIMLACTAIILGAIVAVMAMPGCTTLSASRDTETFGTNGTRKTTHDRIGGTVVDSDAAAKMAGWIAQAAGVAAPFLASWGGPIVASLGSLFVGGTTVGTAVHLHHRSLTRSTNAAYDEGAARAQPIILAHPGLPAGAVIPAGAGTPPVGGGS